MNGSKYALNHVCVYSSANKSIKSAKKRDIFLILHFGRQADGGLLPIPPRWLRYCVVHSISKVT